MPKELLFTITKKDLDIQTFRSGGAGGQNQNKVESGVRIIHRESGAVGESRTERSQHHNKKLALKRLANSEKFKLWIQRKAFELNCDKKEIERRVDEDIKLDNLKIEKYDKDNKKWILYEEKEQV